MRDKNTDSPWRPDTRSRTLLRTALGAVLRRFRRRQCRTLADVAREAGVSLPYLSELERGQKEASSEVLAAICDALGIDLVELLAETGRQLIADRPQRTKVVSIGVLAEHREGRNSTRPGGTSDLRCALAA